MIEQFIYIALGITGVTVLDAIGAILSNKWNFNYGVLTILTIVIYATTSINVTSLGTTTNGIISGCLLGLYDSTIGVLIAKKFNANIGNFEDFEWVIIPDRVFGVIVFAGIISIISIYVYRIF